MFSKIRHFRQDAQPDSARLKKKKFFFRYPFVKMLYAAPGQPKKQDTVFPRGRTQPPVKFPSRGSGFAAVNLYGDLTGVWFRGRGAGTYNEVAANGIRPRSSPVCKPNLQNIKERGST